MRTARSTRARVEELEKWFTGTYCRNDILQDWWQQVLDALWSSATETLPPERVRPFMDDLQARLKAMPQPKRT